MNRFCILMVGDKDRILKLITLRRYRDDTQVLRTWVSRLRKKIEREPHCPTLLRTAPNTGYMIVDPD